MMPWTLGLFGAVLAVLLLARRPRRVEAPSQVSAEWIRQQVRARGLTGWSGAYQEEE